MSAFINDIGVKTEMSTGLRREIIVSDISQMVYLNGTDLQDYSRILTLILQLK